MADNKHPQDGEKQQDVNYCGLISPLALIDGLSPEHWADVQKIVTESVGTLNSPRFTTRMVSQSDGSGVIHTRIVSNLYSDSIVVCDVSCRNPNVMFELGMRLAFDKPVVIIKDDATPSVFDTGVIEYLEYPRDLRYSKIELFKGNLAAKVKATYAASMTADGHQSFLKSFGTIKVAKLETEQVGVGTLVVSLLEGVHDRLDKIERNGSLRVRPKTFSPTTKAELPQDLLGQALRHIEDMFGELGSDTNTVIKMLHDPGWVREIANYLSTLASFDDNTLMSIAQNALNIYISAATEKQRLRGTSV